jgi:hypothetical protein
MASVGRSPVVAPEFSVVVGGPLFQIYRRLHLSDGALHWIARRIIALSLFTWAPLLGLSILGGTAWSGVREPFLLDADVHARLLVALPLLIGSELFVHKRMRITVREFVARGIVPDASQPTFDAIVRSVVRARNSWEVEVCLLLLVYVIGVGVIWQQLVALGTDTWYRHVSTGAVHITAAGRWYELISLPLFQFVLLRWYFRLALWTWFLWRVSKLPLNLVPTHPDRAAGIGFVGASTNDLAPLQLAYGALLAGIMTVGIFFDGRTVISYWPMVSGFCAFVVLIVIGPLLVFVPALARTKRFGLLEYGALSQGYVVDFDRKWVHRGSELDGPLLGSGDIQSLADLANSYHVIGEMRFIPVDPKAALRVILLTVLPTAPLLLTVVPAKDLVSIVMKGLF